MKDLMELILTVNKYMAESGFESKLAIGNDNLKITESEVTIMMPFVLKVSIPKESFDGDDNAISQAVSQAISQVVSHKK
jgi:hypothetical protein